MPSRARPTTTDRRRAGRARGRRPRALVLALLAAGPALSGGCARQEAPPGAEIDNTPPRLASIRPEDGAVVPGLDEPLTLRFDEPVDERRGLERELVASPADRYRVDFGFSTVDIEPREGWRENAVYYVRIPPSFSDVLGNRTEDPIEVTFSTGPPITDTRVEARVRDRVTGEPLREARVLFYREDGDSVPYTAVRDTGEVYRLSALPPGGYLARAFRDLNRNRRLEAGLEAHDSTRFELEGPEDVVQLELRVVEPDSTPPVLASASARDSQLVELQFDDPLDPEQDFGRVEVAVRDTATGRAWRVAAVGLTPEQVGRVERTPPPDGGEDGANGGRATPVADTAPLPSRAALVRLDEPLEDGSVYRVRADGFANLRSLRGGGDTIFVHSAPTDTAAPPEEVEDPDGEAAPRTPADSSSADTTGAAVDSAAGGTGG